MSSPADTSQPPPSTPSPINYILSFLLVGICWGFTTPFIRRAAVSYTAPTNPSITDPSRSWLSRQLAKAFFTVIGLVRKPSYAIPLVANLTGSIWFFLLVGQAELSLTVPITNSLAFLFTVLGEYLAEGKVVGRDTWVGMGCVCAGIGLCVASKL
jgi:drug/metabolite transporter (DMT)-like permease